MGNTNTTPAAKKTPVTLSTRVYESNHGAEPRGRGSWCFVMGAADFNFSDDPRLFWAKDEHGSASMTFAAAVKVAVAEARKRGVTLMGVAP